MHPRSLFSLAEHLDRLSKDGDPLEVLAGMAEAFCQHGQGVFERKNCGETNLGFVDKA